jgi:ribosomal protein L29
MVKAKRWCDESTEQLEGEVKNLQDELFNIKNELAINHKLDKSHMIKATRRDIARILTILTQRVKNE